MRNVFKIHALLMLAFCSVADAQEKPHIVLVFMDKFGWGEPGFNLSLIHI